MSWEGAEICFYYNGESQCVELSDIQFAIIGKILGLEVSEDSISCYSDETLKQFLEMKGNPLRLKSV